MGAGIAALFSQTVNSGSWAANGRGPKLRQLFGAYGNQDCWAVHRKFKQIDDGNGYVSYAELKQIVSLPEFSLLFIWDIFSQQNELIEVRELLVMISLFSSARLEEKGRFLMSLFDPLHCGRCTGEEIAELCVAALGVLARCTKPVVKPKHVTSQLKAELPELLPAYREAVGHFGSGATFKKERLISHTELDELLTSIKDAYAELPLFGLPPPGASPPPPASWASAGMQQGAAGARPSSQGRPGSLGRTTLKAIPPLEAKAKPNDALTWMDRIDVAPVAAEGKRGVVTVGVGSPALGGSGDAGRPGQTAVRVWMVLHGADFASAAKDLNAFRDLVARSLASALGSPLQCIEVVGVTSGIVVELLIHPSSRNGATRTAPELVALLEQQLGLPHSALRKGPFGAYTQNAELCAGEPRRTAGAPGLAGAQCDQAVQADPSELLAMVPLRPASRQARLRPAAVLEEEQEGGQDAGLTGHTAQINEVLRQLEAATRRAEKAEAIESETLEELRKRDAIIAELQTSLSTEFDVLEGVRAHAGGQAASTCPA